MTDPTLSSSTPWDDSSWQLLQEAMDRLIEAWHSDSEPVLSDFVPVPPEDPRFTKMVLHLIETDYECRRKAGKTKEAEDYAADFPQLLGDPEWVRAVGNALDGESCLQATAEYERSHNSDSDVRSNDSSNQSETLRVLCPNPRCRRLLELTEDEVAAKMVCPGCSQGFRLIDAGVPIEALPNDRVRPRKRVAHFELMEQIGTGTFGSVWKARDTQLKRVVAIKIPKAGQFGVDVDRFFREAEAAAQLEHPNIVSVFGEGQEEGVLYIVNRFVDGRNLKDWRDRKESLDYNEIASLCATVADALHYAHGRGVIHRDVKPANILMDADENPHVADFGLAKLVDQQATLSASSNVMGSPSYMSPEQAEGQSHEADARSDVWSLGVILCELLTGILPFRERNLGKLLQMIREIDPPSIRTLDARIPRDLETICAKCLEKDPAQRYQSAEALADDLRRFVNNEPITARPVGLAGKMWRWCNRQPVAAGLAAAFVVAVIGGVTSSLLFAVDSYQQARAATENARRFKKEKQHSQRLAKKEAETRKQVENNAEELKRQLYSSKIHHAAQCINANRHEDAFAILTTIPPELRQWEASYLARQAQGTPLKLFGHVGSVVSSVFSPDGRRIVSASDVGVVRIWNSETGRQVFVLKDPGRENCIAFSHDGRQLAIADSDSVRVLDAQTFKILLLLQGHEGEVNSVAFSPDCQRIVSGSRDKAVKVWNAKTGSEVLTLQGHNGKVNSVAFSPDGQLIVSGGGTLVPIDGEDETVRVWDANTGEEIRTLVGHERSVESVAFSPDGQRIASGSWDATVRVWNLGNGAGSVILRGHQRRVSSVAFSPDGRRIVSGSDDKSVRVWSVEANKEVLALRGHEAGVESVAFSPDGRRIVSAGRDKIVRVWSAETGAETLSANGFTNENIKNVAFSPDKRRVAMASWEKKVRVCDANTGEEILSLEGHERWVTSVAFSPDGQRIVSGSEDDTVRVWNADTGKETLTLRGHEDWVESVAFSANSQQIVSGSGDGTVRVWDANTGKEVLTLQNEGRVTSVAFSPDGRTVVGGGGTGTVRMWNVRTGTKILTIRGRVGIVNAVGVSADGGLVLAAGVDETVVVWDAKTGNEIATFQGQTHESQVTSIAISPHSRQLAIARSETTVKVWDPDTGKEVLTLQGHEGSVDSMVFSPDGQRIAGASDDRTVRVWDANTGNEVLTLRGHEDSVNGVAFSLDGRRIVSGSGDRTVRVWDARAGKETMTFWDDGRVNSVAFSPDGQRVAGGGGAGTVRMWDAQTGEETLNVEGHVGIINCIAFSADGKRIAAAGSDHTVGVWNAETGKETLVLDGHESEVNSVVFSPDGQRIVSAGWDKTVRMWNAGTGEEMLTLQGHKGEVNSVTFSPDGRRIVSGGDDGLRVWDGESNEEVLTLRGRTSSLIGVAFDPHGESLIGHNQDEIARIWGFETGKETLRFQLASQGVESWARGVAFSPDGRRIAIRDSRGIQFVWSTTTGSRLDTDSRTETWTSGLVSPDGLTCVCPIGNTIGLVRANPNYDPWAEDAARRAAWELDWCERDANESETTRNWFAARFHLSRLAELKPDDKAVRSRLKHAEAMLKTEESDNAKGGTNQQQEQGASSSSEHEANLAWRSMGRAALRAIGRPMRRLTNSKQYQIP